jgi:hypothetical protein
MADLQEIRRQFADTLPELAKIIAHDLEHFDTSWLSIFTDYTLALRKLVDILAKLPYGTEEEALKVIEDFIASRQKEYGQWKDASWLSFMLGQVIERAKKRQKRKREKPLADDELPF